MFFIVFKLCRFSVYICVDATIDVLANYYLILQMYIIRILSDRYILDVTSA